ncbi:MAG: serine hydrolase [Bacilli bacterium]|nr:serine hydrolase [Bacilli bacterium]
MTKHKRRKKLSKISKFLLVILICVIGITVYKKYDAYLVKQEKLELLRLEKIEKEKKNKYNNCLLKKAEETDVTDSIKLLITELEDEIKKYNVYVYYEDLSSGFSFKYKENEVIYGASLIKLVDALYLYDNNLDFNSTMTYQSKYIRGSSKGMDARKIGEEISLLDLMNYSLSVSDNTAHIMLVDYIGYNNLRDYGKSLGATSILTGVGGEKYGNQTASDTNIYLKRAYKIMLEHKNGNYLKEFMTNDYQNHLILDNEVKIAHKYGSYSNYFHNIGIVFDENPYTISILTLHGNSNYKDVINNIHKKIYELHISFRENLENNCYKEVYE